MSDRTAILLHCTKDEAGEIRKRARLDRRNVSSYILSIVMRFVEYEERLSMRLSSLRALNDTLARRPTRSVGPRTTVLLRCSVEEAQRIRSCARCRDISISGFVLDSLKRSWSIGPRTLSGSHPAKEREP